MARRTPVEEALLAAKRRRVASINASATKELERNSDRRVATIGIAAPKAAKRKKSKALAKGKKAVRKSLGLRVDDVVNSFAQQHGNYAIRDIKLVEVVEKGKIEKKQASAVRNLEATVVERWHHRGVFDARQMAAILFYQEAYRKVFGSGPNITAGYSPVIIRGLREAAELWASSTLAAKESLRLLDQEVFFRESLPHFSVWQNVVIFDQPASVAGGLLGFNSRNQAEAVAREIVSGIAYKVADIVIDSSRKDFGDLLLDLDAPRRPGRRTG